MSRSPKLSVEMKFKVEDKKLLLLLARLKITDSYRFVSVDYEIFCCLKKEKNIFFLFYIM